MPKNAPLVAIYTLVYNHAPFLRDYFEGVIAQQTNFPFIAVVHDDCSTDGSTDIIREYAEKYPQIIKPIYEGVNCYQNDLWDQVIVKMRAAYKDAKYIAFCEGDDYWTDPLKLQKQVDILEQHPEYAFCCHRYKIIHESDHSISSDYAQDFFKDGEDLVVTQELQSRTWLTKVLTMVIRVDLYIQAFDEAKRKYGNECLDTCIFYELLKLGNGIALNQFMGMYRQQNNGIWSRLNLTQKARSNYQVLEMLYENNRDDKYILQSLQHNAIHYVRFLSCWNTKNWPIFKHIYAYMNSSKLKTNAILSFILPVGLIQATKKLFNKC